MSVVKENYGIVNHEKSLSDDLESKDSNIRIKLWAMPYDSLWLISLRQGTYMLICSWLKTYDDDGGNDDEDDGGNDDDGDGGGGGDKECDHEHEE